MRFWMERALTDLEQLEQRRLAVDGLGVQIRQLEADAASLPGVRCDSVPVRGGGNKQERRLCALVESKQKLEREQASLRELVAHTERALKSLPEKERITLTELYTKDKYRGEAVRELEERLHVGRSEVYRIKDQALRQFALRMGYTVG